MAGERTFVVKILGDAGSAVAAFKKLQSEGEKVTGALGNQAQISKDMFKQVSIAAAATFAAGTAFLAASVNAAIQDQQEQVKLAQTLKNTTGATDDQIAATEKLISAMSLASGTADSELRVALEILTRGSGSLTQAQRDLTLAQDIATATSIPLASVSDALARSYNDNFKSLKALSPALADNIKEGQSLDTIFKELNATFGGSTAAATDTAAGQMKIFKNQMSELSESVGAALVPALAAVLPLFQAVATFAQEHSTIFAALIIATTLLAGATLLYSAYLKLLPLRIAAVAAAQTILNFLMTANPLGLMVVGVAALTVVFIALAGGMDNLIRLTKEMFNSFNKLVNLFLPDMLEIPMYNVAKATSEITRQNHKAIPIADQIGTKYLEIAGACIEILKVPLAKQLETQTDRLTGLAFSLGVTSVSYGKFDKGLSGVSKTVETASEKLKKYTDALDQSFVAEKTLTRATKDRGLAQESLNVAKNGVLAAQKAFNDAVNGFGAESVQAKNAQRELAKSQRSVEQAGYRVEESLFAVKDAEKVLADLRKDPATSAQAIREAEINLAQAKINVAEATDSQFEATNGLETAQLALNEAVSGAVEGSKTYNDLQLAVTDAKKREIQASEGLSDAIDRETQAYKDLQEAIKAANTAARTAGVSSTAPLLPGMPTPGGGPGGGQVMTPLPTVPQPAPVGGGFQGRPEQGAPNIIINTGIGTNGIEAGRQIVEVLQQYSRLGVNVGDLLAIA